MHVVLYRLGAMERQMQCTIKDLAEAVAEVADRLPPQQLVAKNTAQMAILGLQIGWTAACERALEK